jgi:hypothetical protein
VKPALNDSRQTGQRSAQRAAKVPPAFPQGCVLEQSANGCKCRIALNCKKIHSEGKNAFHRENRCFSLPLTIRILLPLTLGIHSLYRTAPPRSTCHEVSRNGCVRGLISVSRSQVRVQSVRSGVESRSMRRGKGGTTLCPTIKSNFLTVRGKENCS